MNGRVPEARRGHAAVGCGSKVVVTGGEGTGDVLEVQVCNVESHHVLEWVECVEKAKSRPRKSKPCS